MNTKREIPRIIIKYGKLLDPIFIFYCQNNPELKSRGWNDWVPPSSDIISKRIENYKKEWAKSGDDILCAVCDILELGFNREVIDVYIVSGISRQLSDPLIIKSGYNPDEFIGILIHELIHNLFQNNAKKIPRSILDEMFPNETYTTQNHIITFSVIKYICVDVVKGLTWVEDEIRNAKKYTNNDYSRAWEIVEQRGYYEIIDDLKKRYRVL